MYSHYDLAEKWFSPVLHYHKPKCSMFKYQVCHVYEINGRHLVVKVNMLTYKITQSAILCQSSSLASFAATVLLLVFRILHSSPFQRPVPLDWSGQHAMDSFCAAEESDDVSNKPFDGGAHRTRSRELKRVQQRKLITTMMTLIVTDWGFRKSQTDNVELAL